MDWQIVVKLADKVTIRGRILAPSLGRLKHEPIDTRPGFIYAGIKLKNAIFRSGSLRAETRCLACLFDPNVAKVEGASAARRPRVKL